MGKLIPGEVLIYERVDNTVYARYRDRPEIPRWVIGKDPHPIFGYGDWIDMLNLSYRDEAFAKDFDRLMTHYFLKKDNNAK